MAKDKRSRRDKLKDGIVENMEKDIGDIEDQIKKREQENAMDNRMVATLRAQINDIHLMCTKQDETYMTKKSDGKKAT